MEVTGILGVGFLLVMWALDLNLGHHTCTASPELLSRLAALERLMI